MTNKVFKWTFWTVLVAVLAIYPKLFGIYYTNLFVTFAVFAIFSVSFNLLLGYTGLLSFGHAMFFGVGGYGTALALKHIRGLALLPAVLIGLVSAMVLALILCPLVVRVSGTAFSMLHLAFGQLMHMLAYKLRSITGGEDGIGGFPIPSFGIPGVISIDMRAPENFYYFAIIILGISLWMMWFFTKTPFGQVQVGVRDNANRIGYLGFKVTQTKAVVYVVAGAFAGVAGSIYALFQNLISSGALDIFTSFTPVTMTMVGGIGSFLGPVLGAAIIQVMEELTTRFTEQVELVVGLILILVILFIPMGFMGLIRLLRQKWTVHSARTANPGRTS
ncbi:MAG TPA: branched-chain amino acid ABC transporter permease [Thermodesulfobacteriota bacterium]|nr:branched-chain amino acid ABC transporter permease [Thermodesulfobacteriota bacterium]